MKSFFMDKSLAFLCKYNTYSDEDIEKLSYGLEGIYLTITKLIIIFALALLLNIFKEIIFLLIIFNIIRYFGFGIHAKKSSECLISSIIFFIGLPYICLNEFVTNEILIIIAIIGIISFIPFAPADTKKRPFYNKKKKFIRKILTIAVGIIYLIGAITIKNSTISKLFLIAIIIQAIVINPITYMIMNEPYNNSKNDKKMS